MTGAITDFTQYTELRRDAQNNDPAALREVAGQFEALFLQMMLKNMREASIGDSLMGDSEQHEMYQGMLDQQLAMEMASGKGIGLAEMLVRQLGGEPQVTLAKDAEFTMREMSGANGIPPNKPEPAWADPASFARDVWPHAERVAEELGVAPEGVLAQAALETGWGQHVMPARSGETSFNLFGIKAGRGWEGQSVGRQTIEFDGGVARQEIARFRAYDDVGATFDDYVELLTANPRYESVRGHGDNISGFASALQQSGYATDPDYADKISRVASSDTMQAVLAGLKNPPNAPISN